MGSEMCIRDRYCSELKGLPNGPVRAPMRPLKKEQKRELREVMETVDLNLQSILGAKKNSKERNHVKLVK